MPTQTFWNLPEAKRNLLIDLALDEFAEHDFASASISRLVARAGIAKGSIYQYFRDKQDLFLYLLDLAIDRQLELLRQEGAAQPGSEFFEVLRRQMSATTRVALAVPRLHKLTIHAFAGNLPFQDEIFRRARNTSTAYLSQLVQDGIREGTIATDLEPELVTFVVTSVTGQLGPYLVGRLGLDQAAGPDALEQFRSADVEQIFDAVIRILKHGLSSQPGRG
jgi:AcrR family transcriptional regulator